jgi:hypothetical protein
MEAEIVPLISSSVAGPLGILHLPRLWLKILLYAAGRLREGYRHGFGGFDEMLCDNLGIDRDALIAYVEGERPGYLAFERWVGEHASRLDAASIASHNHAILSCCMSEAMAEERRTRLGIADASFNNGVDLNNLDDWDAVHRQLMQERV